LVGLQGATTLNAGTYENFFNYVPPPPSPADSDIGLNGLTYNPGGYIYVGESGVYLATMAVTVEAAVPITLSIELLRVPNPQTTVVASEFSETGVSGTTTRQLTFLLNLLSGDGILFVATIASSSTTVAGTSGTVIPSYAVLQRIA